MIEYRIKKVYEIKRTDDEIEYIEAWANKASLEDKQTHFPGMTYEDGVRQTLDWLFGINEDSPSGNFNV
jgi:hypothetical protein